MSSCQCASDQQPEDGATSQSDNWDTDCAAWQCERCGAVEPNVLRRDNDTDAALCGACHAQDCSAPEAHDDPLPVQMNLF